MTQYQKTLLLVEDNADDAELMLSALRDSQLKAQVVHVKDGAEALEYLFDSSHAFESRPLPHWILLDLKLPKISGLEVLRQLRSNIGGAMIPVVVFTSSKEESDIIESYRLNVNSYLQKPIDFEEFESVVKRLCVYWIEMNQYPQTWDKVRAKS